MPVVDLSTDSQRLFGLVTVSQRRSDVGLSGMEIKLGHTYSLSLPPRPLPYLPFLSLSLGPPMLERIVFLAVPMSSLGAWPPRDPPLEARPDLPVLLAPAGRSDLVEVGVAPTGPLEGGGLRKGEKERER